MLFENLCIILNEYGEALVIDRANAERFSHLIRDRDEIGKHHVCTGPLYIKKISETHSVILCEDCGLRVPVPNEVNTYEELKEHFASFNQ